MNTKNRIGPNTFLRGSRFRGWLLLATTLLLSSCGFRKTEANQPVGSTQPEEVRQKADPTSVPTLDRNPVLAPNPLETTKPTGTLTEILWDDWGVPHIFAPNLDELQYAFGWAQMHNQADSILNLFGLARGRSAEYWGGFSYFIDSDVYVRRLRVPQLAQSWYVQQDLAGKRMLDAFSAGMNAYAEAFPNRIKPNMRQVLPVTSQDVLANIIRVIPVNFVGGYAQAEIAAWRKSGLKMMAPVKKFPGKMGSNGWAISPTNTQAGNALLLVNPHLLWPNPDSFAGMFTFMEVQLVLPETNMYGVAFIGFPFIAMGFNDFLGWANTVNTLDGMDLYELTLEGEGYVYDKAVLPFKNTTEIMKIKLEDGSLKEVVLHFQYAVQGPVVAKKPKQGKALALRLVGLDLPFVTQQFWAMARARNLSQFKTALSDLQMPMFNFLYADGEGNIMYLFNGTVPDRPFGDWTYWMGIIPGNTSETLWTETLPFEDLPILENPSNGWVQNANGPPWFTTFPRLFDESDFPPYLSPFVWGERPFRPQRSVQMISAEDRFSYRSFFDAIRSTRCLLADRILDDLIPAVRLLGNPLAQEAADVLEAWDRKTFKNSCGGVLFQAWFQELDNSPKPFATKWLDPFDRITPDALGDPVAAVEALEIAAAQVKDGYGDLAVAWGEVFRLRYAGKDLPANGGPGQLGVFSVVDFSPDEDNRFSAAGGDTFIAAIEFSDPIRARVLLTYGNSTQIGSPHMGDQLELFSKELYRKALRTLPEIERHLENREVFDFSKISF